MNAASTSETSSTRSNDDSVKAFATLRFVGDNLDPDEISRILAEKPTKAHRKGERFSPGPRSRAIFGKTGIWYLSTRRRIHSADIIDHLEEIIALIFPFAAGERTFKSICDIMRDKDIQAHVTVFWRGPSRAAMPSIPNRIIDQLSRLPADIERDFDSL
jgi:hypothetical protein